MKKIILIAGLVFCGLTTQAQIDVYGNGSIINNGETITVSELGTPTQLNLTFSNTSTDELTMRMKVKTITNNSNASTNNSLQLCIQPQCFNNISEGTTIPTQGAGVTIAAGSDTHGIDNHFKNNHLGSEIFITVHQFAPE